MVGGNILDVRILEKMTNHFLRNPYKRPGILSNRITTSKNPGTFVWIPQKSGWSFFREFGRTDVLMYPRKNDQPLFEESVQTSRDSFGWGYNSNKSWDVRLNLPESGVSFVSCPHGGRGKYFGGCFGCPHGCRGKYFGGFVSCPHGGRGKYVGGFVSCSHGGGGTYFGGFLSR